MYKKLADIILMGLKIRSKVSISETPRLQRFLYNNITVVIVGQYQQSKMYINNFVDTGNAASLLIAKKLYTNYFSC